MLLPADLFLAFRYLRPKRTFVSVITLLSILGPTLGVAVLIIVTGVMSGFDRDIRQTILDVQAHIQLYPKYGSVIEKPEDIVSFVNDELNCKAAPLIDGDGLVQVHHTIAPKWIRGIDPEQEKSVSTLHNSILDGRYGIKEGECLVGDTLALNLNLQVGSTLLIHSPAKLTKNIKWKDDGSVEITEPDEVYMPEQVKVAGIYSMGLSDYDDNVIFLHIDQAAELYGYEWGSATCVQCKTPDPMNMGFAVEALRKRFFQMSVVTWQERNKMLFGTLRVEKNLMTFLMAFIVLVASFSIATTLITVVVQKTREVGVMKAIGFSRWMIARVFLFQGTIIGVIGTALGTTFGLLVIHYRDAIADFLSYIMGHDVFPAELYHLRRLPAYLSCGDLTFIITLSLCICIFSAIVPSLYASSLAPAKALQEEN